MRRPIGKVCYETREIYRWINKKILCKKICMWKTYHSRMDLKFLVDYEYLAWKYKFFFNTAFGAIWNFFNHFSDWKFDKRRKCHGKNEIRIFEYQKWINVYTKGNLVFR